MKPIQVSIVDDHALVMRGIEKLLESYPHIRMEGKYSNGRALLEGLKERLPDILLMDIHMPDLDGEALMDILRKKYPDLKVIALTGQDTPYYIQSMMNKGCKGYLLKNAPEEEIISAIQSVYEGNQYIEQSIRENLLFDMLKQNSRGAMNKAKLTNREKEILKLIVEEYTSQEMAEKLFLSLKTIEKYRINLLQKLQAKNTAGLVKAAIQQNILND